MHNLRLVNFNGEWAVCRIMLVDEERGEYDLPTDPVGQYEAWVYGPDNTVLCRVGQQGHVYVLPQWEPTNFFNDRFPFAIDVQADGSDYREKVGGCTNALAAKAAAEVYVHEENRSKTVRLRHGARIIIEEKGKGDFAEWLASRRKG